MNKHLPPSCQGTFDKPVRQPEELLGIFLCGVSEVNILVLEVFLAFGVGLAGHVQDMRDTQVQHMLPFQPGYKVAQVESRDDLNALEALQEAVGLATTKIGMREPVAVDILFVVCVVSGVDCHLHYLRAFLSIVVWVLCQSQIFQVGDVLLVHHFLNGLGLACRLSDVEAAS